MTKTNKITKRIEELKRIGDCDGVTCYCPGDYQDDCEIYLYNQAIDKALQIIKEESEES